jgi:hypothetical protein
MGLSCHPSNPSLFLSASSDGTIRLFDTRTQPGCIGILADEHSMDGVEYHPSTPDIFAYSGEDGHVGLVDGRMAWSDTNGARANGGGVERVAGHIVSEVAVVQVRFPPLAAFPSHSAFLLSSLRLLYSRLPSLRSSTPPSLAAFPPRNPYKPPLPPSPQSPSPPAVLSSAPLSAATFLLSTSSPLRPLSPPFLPLHLRLLPPLLKKETTSSTLSREGTAILARRNMARLAEDQGRGREMGCSTLAGVMISRRTCGRFRTWRR